MTIIYDMPEREYHAHPALSSTQARQILDSPAKYKWAQDHPQEPRAAFDVGTAAHTKILGVGAGVVVYPDEHLTGSGAVSTKAATVAWAAEQREAGLTPISPRDAAAVDGIAEAVLANRTARALLEQSGHSETSVFATDHETGIDVRCRFDFLPEPGKNRTVAVDLKTTAKTADAGAFARSAASFGYEVQRAHYLDTYRMETGDEDAEMVFIVVEKAGPYLVAVHQLDREFADMGHVKAAHARRTLAECRAADEWPGYEDKITLAKAPVFAIYDFQDRYENE